MGKESHLLCHVSNWFTPIGFNGGKVTSHTFTLNAQLVHSPGQTIEDEGTSTKENDIRVFSMRDDNDTKEFDITIPPFAYISISNSNKIILKLFKTTLSSSNTTYGFGVHCLVHRVPYITPWAQHIALHTLNITIEAYQPATMDLPHHLICGLHVTVCGKIPIFSKILKILKF
jgi:hypothetical protein